MTKALSQAVEEAFGRFWAAYPARPENPRAAARAQFAKLVAAGEAPEALIRAAGAYAAFCAKARKDPLFIPHARTWLSQRRFEDFADAPEQAGAGQPVPEHPLAWLAAEIGDAAWASWIAPLQLVADDAPAAVLARTQFALDRVRSSWGGLIRARYGQVVWGLQTKGDMSSEQGKTI